MSGRDPGQRSDAEDGGPALDLPTGEGSGDTAEDTSDATTAIATTSVEDALADGEHLR